MKLKKWLLATTLFGLAVGGTGYAQRIDVDVPPGVTKVADGRYSVGGDLNIMFQLYQPKQYKHARFFQAVVKAEFQEKQKELQNIKYPTKTQKLIENDIGDGLKGHGFVLMGENDKGEKAAICGYYLEKGDQIVKVTIMGNGVTYEAHTNTITQLLKAVRVADSATLVPRRVEKSVSPPIEEFALEPLRARIDAGDPTVVPVLRELLAKATDGVFPRDKSERLLLVIRGLGAYGDAASVPLLDSFYKSRRPSLQVWQAAADALANIGAKETITSLRQIVWQQELPLAVRCKAAGSLVRLDSDLGRQFLLLQYDLYRLERKSMNAWAMDPVRDILEHLEDRQILAGLEERLRGEDNQTMRNNITTLRERMLLNQQPLTSLKTIAADTKWDVGMYRRYPALEAIGQKGGPELIPFLESIQPWNGIEEGQQRILKQCAVNAILQIRRRHWKEMKAVEQDGPVNVEQPRH